MSRFTHAGIVRPVIDIPAEPAEAPETYDGGAGPRTGPAPDGAAVPRWAA
ncbi:hypothetical protein GCM10018980_63500 [Streptomyces capoamus]|uniref:Uncharacterized protein n=1 Tax=Streptomyces capoamus TaxID=68183 RepID=A0A919F1S3_9ACTN|nr:hypothetical protein GCM10010501_23580 [Streptomyces libani subsp. rufus]GHG69367.1 hypothetical protein GCM10018980_63500 [Streptomyces capoamus]